MSLGSGFFMSSWVISCRCLADVIAFGNAGLVAAAITVSITEVAVPAILVLYLASFVLGIGIVLRFRVAIGITYTFTGSLHAGIVCVINILAITLVYVYLRASLLISSWLVRRLLITSRITFAHASSQILFVGL